MPTPAATTMSESAVATLAGFPTARVEPNQTAAPSFARAVVAGRSRVDPHHRARRHLRECGARGRASAREAGVVSERRGPCAEREQLGMLWCSTDLTGSTASSRSRIASASRCRSSSLCRRRWSPRNCFAVPTGRDGGPHGCDRSESPGGPAGRHCRPAICQTEPLVGEVVSGGTAGSSTRFSQTSLQ
jgi:hypothetical protein